MEDIHRPISPEQAVITHRSEISVSGRNGKWHYLRRKSLPLEKRGDALLTLGPILALFDMSLGKSANSLASSNGCRITEEGMRNKAVETTQNYINTDGLKTDPQEAFRLLLKQIKEGLARWGLGEWNGALESGFSLTIAMVDPENGKVSAISVGTNRIAVASDNNTIRLVYEGHENFYPITTAGKNRESPPVSQIYSFHPDETVVMATDGIKISSSFLSRIARRPTITRPPQLGANQGEGIMVELFPVNQHRPW